VNKVGVQRHQKDPQSLIYPKYLNPPSSNSQWTPLSHVFTSYLDPAISSNCIHQKMVSFNASNRHQNNSQHSNLVWYVFGL